MLDLRAVAYMPSGGRLGVLPDDLDVTLTVPVADMPTVALTYPAGTQGVRGELLDSEVEIAIEITHDGITWLEPPGARFISQKVEGNLLDDGTSPRILHAAHVSSQLAEAVVWDVPPAAQDSDGKWNFLSANAGVILRSLWDAATKRGWGKGLTLDCTTVADSAGKKWANIVTLAFDKAVTLATVVDSLRDLGLCDVEWTGRTMRVHNPDGALARRREKVLWPLAVGTAAAPEATTWTSLCTDVLVKGEGGRVWRIHNDQAPAGLRRIERVVEAGGVELEATARLVAQATLASGASAQVEAKREWVASDALLLPWRDYTAGDWITVQRSAGREVMRVAQVSVTRNADGVSGHTTFGTRLDDVLSHVAKRTKGVTGGASTSGSGVRPAPQGQDKRTPAKVLGLVVRAEAVPVADRTVHGLLRATWQPVSTATDASAMEISSYDLAVRRNVVGAPWLIAGSASSTSLDLREGSPGEALQVQVRARGTYATTPGLWSDPFTVQIPQPELLAPPTAAHLACEHGLVTVTWDRHLAGPGGPIIPPSWLRHVLVQEASSAAGPWTDLAELSLDGPTTVLDRQDVIGQERFYRLVAVDTVDRKSDPGNTAGITVRSKVSEAVDAAQAKADQAARDGATTRAQVEAQAKKIDTIEGTVEGLSSKLAAAESAAAEADKNAKAAAASASKADAAASAAQKIAEVKAAEAERAAKAYADGLKDSTLSEAQKAALKVAAEAAAKAQQAAEAKAADAQRTAEAAEVTAATATENATQARTLAEASKKISEQADSKAGQAQAAATAASGVASAAQSKAAEATTKALAAQAAAAAAAAASPNLAAGTWNARWAFGKNVTRVDYGTLRFKGSNGSPDFSNDNRAYLLHGNNQALIVPAGRVMRFSMTVSNPGNSPVKGKFSAYTYAADGKWLGAAAMADVEVPPGAVRHVISGTVVVPWTPARIVVPNVTWAGTAPIDMHGATWSDVTDIAAAQDRADHAAAEAVKAKTAADTATAKALAAQSVADAAAAKATTADGRYTVAAANPSAKDGEGKPSGAVWEVRAGTTALRRFVWDGPAWRQVKIGVDFIGEKAVNRAQIADAAVGTLQVADASITNAKVGWLTAEKIRAAVGTLDAGFIKSLFSDSGFIRNLFSERISVSAGSLFPDPLLENKSEWNFAAGVASWKTDNAVSGNVLVLKATGKQIGGYLQPPEHRDASMILKPGATYRLSLMVRFPSFTGSNPASVYLRHHNSTGGVNIMRVADIFAVLGGAPTAWTRLETQFTLPATDKNGACTLGLFAEATFTSGSVEFAEVRVEEAVGTTLIEPGSITTPLLAAGAVTAKTIAVNAIEGGHIKGDALDGKVITGATIQTAKTGARVVMTPQGLTAYSNAGTKTFWIDSATGQVTAKGYFSIEDEWSATAFRDIGTADNVVDIDPGKWGHSNWGTGLVFYATNARWDRKAFITARQHPQGEPALILAGPLKTAGQGQQSYLSMMGPTAQLYGGSWDANADPITRPSVLLSPAVASLTCQKTSLNISGNSIGALLGYNSSRVFEATGQTVRLMCGDWGDSTGFFANKTNTVMTWAANRQLGVDVHGVWFFKGEGHNPLRVAEESCQMTTMVWGNCGFWANKANTVMGYSSAVELFLNGSGMHVKGTKNFVMAVPGETERRGGLLLRHSSTESPYDGVEYWQTLALDSQGRGMWVLPAYVPAIGAPKAPWIALASTQDGSPVAARLVQDQWGPDATPWHVELHGSPGVMVSVLVKGARILDTKTGWEDRTGQDLWVMPPQTPGDAEASMSVGGDVYGPAPNPHTKKENTHE